MGWTRTTAQQRIDDLLTSVPEVRTVDFREEWYPRVLQEAAENYRASPTTGKSLQNIPRNRAILVDGVHVYARLANYDDYRLEGNDETELSHKRGLNFLHLHYSATDRIIEEMGAVRIDYHGSRLHCVVIDPVDDEVARVKRALDLAQRLIEFSQVANELIAKGRYGARMKIGIDSGKCVAINSGRGKEQEPLFLGNAANYAAKLADGEGQGIFPSNRVRMLLGLSKLQSDGLINILNLERSSAVPLTAVAQIVGKGRYADRNIFEDADYRRIAETWRNDIVSHKELSGGKKNFIFHQHTPPLASIKFEDLMPSNSILMPLVSIFADVSGYTKCVAEAIASGQVAEAIRAIHVIRGELANVLKHDFRSRKVRFIGDCVHGVIALNNNQGALDSQLSSQEALRCAAAMRSSFDMIGARLPFAKQQLGLAIGFEHGPTPISRIGRRGDDSVRVASSQATIVSEAEQRRADGRQCIIGEKAYLTMPPAVRRQFPDRIATGLDFDTYAIHFAGAPGLVGTGISNETIDDHGTSASRSHSQ